jgi:hypothetical protein
MNGAVMNFTNFLKICATLTRAHGRAPTRGAKRHAKNGFETMDNRDDQVRQNDPSAMGGYQTSGSQRIVNGMTVFDVNGEKLGKVTGANARRLFHSQEGDDLHPRLLRPMSAVARIDPDGVYLNVAKNDIKNRG